MQIKFILFLTSLCVSAYAARDDCKELGDLLKESMTDCKMNDNGEMIELEYNTYNEETTEEAYKKALSYQTLKKLSFYDQYADCKQLSYGLSNLKNLEELNISSFRGLLVPNTLKGLTSLKKFSFSSGDYIRGLKRENIEELATLTNLESLEFYFTRFDDSLPLLQNLNKVTSLTLGSNSKAGMDVEGCLATFKNIKSLSIEYYVQYQSQVDAITSYTNLENLNIEFKKDKINCDNMKNLTKLSTLNLIIGGENEAPKCVYTIPNLQKLTFNGKEIPLNNGNNTTTGNNTNQTTGNNANQTTGNNANQAAGNNVDQVAGNDTNQVPGNFTDQAAGNNTIGGTTTIEPNDNDIDSGVGSTIVHAINYLPIMALVFRMLL